MNLLIGSLLFVLTLFSVSSLPAEEATSPAQSKPEIIIPVRIHLVQSEQDIDLATTLTDDDIQRIMTKVNMIWSQAHIRFTIEAINKTVALNIKSPDDKAKNFLWVMAMMPKASLLQNGLNIYYVKNLGPNGFYSRGLIYVKDTARLQAVPGGLDEPIPRVTSHEIGHALGLPHRQDVTNLMASGKSGFSLNETEIEITRNKAIELFGTTNE